jgi:nucleoid DNA-binding protein
MKMPDIAKSMARRARVTHAEGADQLDRVVHQILSNLRKGQPAPLPGLGRFTHGADGQIAFEQESKKRERTPRG